METGKAAIIRRVLNSLPMKELIIGGARSGKSRLAEARALAGGLAVTYVATAEARDDEMAARIAHHRARRPAGWLCVEEPLRLAVTLARLARPDACLLVDCLTLWLSNLLLAGGELPDNPLPAAEIDALLAILPDLPGRLILVSNEVGCGIVPANALGRRFADEQGWLNQRVAAACDEVTLVAAGLPLTLKSAGTTP
jgi:adenosylcobinamide kinase/adenosylcobinamide-phosphate guanylyltransferase